MYRDDERNAFVFSCHSSIGDLEVLYKIIIISEQLIIYSDFQVDDAIFKFSISAGWVE